MTPEPWGPADAPEGERWARRLPVTSMGSIHSGADSAGARLRLDPIGGSIDRRPADHRATAPPALWPDVVEPDGSVRIQPAPASSSCSIAGANAELGMRGEGA
jgi:hypothetical protein